ncbi:hypothetical protein AMTR_s00126p00122490 [Amborella trichopoda]|uniref:EF-hand domain-containing protein n=2 Tax=Amborella trichopoda TaxID=13333 RepID=W1NQR8_AMBTC|nr:hypothetical protein AMTR_s00126p00122490 [Amborella trichopoda]
MILDKDESMNNRYKPTVTFLVYERYKLPAFWQYVCGAPSSVPLPVPVPATKNAMVLNSTPKNFNSKEEFIAWMMEYDRDGDGRISKGELREVVSKLGSWFPWFRCRKAMAAADANHNGIIDDGEMPALVNYLHEWSGVKITVY